MSKWYCGESVSARVQALIGRSAVSGREWLVGDCLQKELNEVSRVAIEIRLSSWVIDALSEDMLWVSP